jgi:hypothetical protein
MTTVRSKSHFLDLSLRDLIHQLYTNTAEAKPIRDAVADRCAKFNKDLYDQVRDEVNGVKLSNGNGPRPKRSHYAELKAKARQVGGGSKGVHARCYDEMCEEYAGEDLPSATPIAAAMRTRCPHCRNMIEVGEDIVMTSMEEWN